MATKNSKVKSFEALNKEMSEQQKKHEADYKAGKIPHVPLTVGKSKPAAGKK